MPHLPPIAIVVSRYNRSVTDRLLAGAIAAYVELGGRERDLKVVDAAGAFEIPFLVSAALGSGGFLGAVAIGCIIKGETSHDEVLGHAVTGTLASISASMGPVGLAVLTVNTTEQAKARAGGTLGNKGGEAMTAVLQSLAAARAVQPRIGKKFAKRLAKVPRPGQTAPDKGAKGASGESASGAAKTAKRGAR